MFISKNQVHMHDTDMAGILYFPRQFRFANDALEELMEVEGMNFQHLFNHSPWVFLTVHVEADYKISLYMGDKIEVHVSLNHIGNSSFSFLFTIFRNPGECVGTVKSIHVAIDRVTRGKIPIPDELKALLLKLQD